MPLLALRKGAFSWLHCYTPLYEKGTKQIKNRPIETTNEIGQNGQDVKNIPKQVLITNESLDRSAPTAGDFILLLSKQIFLG